MSQPHPKTKSSDKAAAARKPKAALAPLAPDSHYGEGAASAWETWNQLEHHRARTRGDGDTDSALAPPRKPKSP